MTVDRGYFYDSGSILVNEYLSHGTLLDLVNSYRLNVSLLHSIYNFKCIEFIHFCFAAKHDIAGSAGI